MELEKYRQPWETGRQWELRKEFLKYYKDFFPEEKLLCLAQVYTNVSTLQCSYPPKVMETMEKLVKHLKAHKSVDEIEKPESKDEVLNEEQSKRSKRKLEEEPPLARSKKMATLEEEKQELIFLKEDEKIEILPLGMVDADYYTIAVSDNFDIIKKLSTEVRKLIELQDGNAFDLILSAALHVNVEDMVDLKYTSQNDVDSKSEEKFYCEFFIGSTKLAIGSGENRYIAKKTASEKALDTLSNLCLIDKLGEEVADISSSKSEKPFDIVLLGTMRLGIEHLLAFKYGEKLLYGAMDDYTYMRTCCEIFIGAVKFAEAYSYNKCKAKRRALCHAIYILTHLKNLPPEKSLKKMNVWIKQNLRYQCDQSSSKVPPSSGKAEWDETWLDKLAFEIKRLHLKKEPPVPGLKMCFESLGRPDDLKYIVRRVLPKKGGLPSYSCDVLLNNVPLASGKAMGKKMATSNAAKNFFNLFLDLFERKKNPSCAPEDIYADILLLMDKHSKGSLEVKDSSTQEGAVFLEGFYNNKMPVEDPYKVSYRMPDFVNKRLYNNSVKLNFLLCDKSELPSRDKLTDMGHLSNSATLFQRSIRCEFEMQTDNKLYRADIQLQGKVIGSGYGDNRFQAKNHAARVVLQKLQKELYTVKVKYRGDEDENIVINPEDVRNLRYVRRESRSRRRDSSSSSSDEEKDRKYKIVCPENKKFEKLFRRFADIGKKKRSERLSNFEQKMETLLRGYSMSDELRPIGFSPKFTQKEKMFITKTGLRYKLWSKCQNSTKVQNLRRRRSVKEFLDALIKAGGKTPKYELIDAST